jgi:hypothetical protein
LVFVSLMSSAMLFVVHKNAKGSAKKSLPFFVERAILKLYRPAPAPAPIPLPRRL